MLNCIEKLYFFFWKINLKAILKKKIYTDFKLTWRKLATNSTHRQANNLQIKHTKSVFHNTYTWKYRLYILSIFIHLLCSTITYPAVPRIVFFTLQYLPCPPPLPQRSWNLFRPAVLTLPPRSWSLSCSAVCTWSDWQLPPGSSETPPTHCVPCRRSLSGHRKYNIGQQVKIIHGYQLLWQRQSKNDDRVSNACVGN